MIWIETVASQLVQKIEKAILCGNCLELGPVFAIVSLCSVTIERERKRAFIGLGTNMGDKQL